MVQDFAHNFAIGHDHFGQVGVTENGREQFDGFHPTLDADHGDVFAHAKRFGENNGEPGDQIAEHSLHRQRHAGAGDAETGDQWQEFHAELIQRHEQKYAEDEDPDHAQQQQSHRRLQVQLVKRMLHQAADPAGDKETDSEDNQR